MINNLYNSESETLALLLNKQKSDSFYEDNWRWNSESKSEGIKLSDNQRSLLFPCSFLRHTSSGVRGTKILNGACHYWEIDVSSWKWKPRASSIERVTMLGIGTNKARLDVRNFTKLMGQDENSWGLTTDGFLWHADVCKPYFPFHWTNSTKPIRHFFTFYRSIGIYFDGIAGTLTYYLDGVCLGVAFTGLQNIKEALYPMVCSSVGGDQIYLTVMKKSFGSLQTRCRATILPHLTKKEQIDQFQIPSKIKDFIKN